MIAQSKCQELFGNQNCCEEHQQHIANFVADVSAGDPGELARLLDRDTDFVAELFPDELVACQGEVAFLGRKVVVDPTLERDLVEVQ